MLKLKVAPKAMPISLKAILLLTKGRKEKT